ncbi:MAG: hypothetical protein AB7M05_08925 [Alphaproteobacteria bacterium]
MTHVRQQIRDAVATTLTGLSITGSNVFVSRTAPLTSGDLPALEIFTLKEPVRTISRERTQMRDLEVLVDACVDSSSSTADDELDDICSEVETALSASVTISAVVVELVLAETNIELKSEADPSVAVAHMKYVFTVQTAQGAPDVPL